MNRTAYQRSQRGTPSCGRQDRVEASVEAGGPDRVVFGTDLPLLHPAPFLSMVVHSRLTDQEKALILGGNMKRFMGEKK